VVKDYDALGTAADPEIGAILGAQQLLEKNCIYLEADNPTITRWEKLLKIIPGVTDDLELRRFRVAARLGSQPPYTERQMHKALEALVGSGAYTAVLNVAQEHLSVRIALGRKALLAEAARMLDDMVPLNMVLEVTVMYNTHQVLSAFTHAQLGEKTHYELRNEVIEGV
jgi:hypothetical protein